jgi:hypothetical protein
MLITMSDSEDISVDENILKKNEEKEFPDKFMSEIYEIEQTFTGQRASRPEAQKQIRKKILDSLPEDITELAKYNESVRSEDVSE